MVEFKVGDVVELRSGGPAMTVMGYEVDQEDGEPTRLLCSFFTDGELTTMGFESGVLAMSPDKNRYSPKSILSGGLIDAAQEGFKSEGGVVEHPPAY